jgi:hypothetical protein
MPHLIKDMKRISTTDLLKNDESPAPDFYAISKLYPLPPLPAKPRLELMDERHPGLAPSHASGHGNETARLHSQFGPQSQHLQHSAALTHLLPGASVGTASATNAPLLRLLENSMQAQQVAHQHQLARLLQHHMLQPAPVPSHSLTGTPSFGGFNMEQVSMLLRQQQQQNLSNLLANQTLASQQLQQRQSQVQPLQLTQSDVAAPVSTSQSQSDIAAPAASSGPELLLSGETGETRAEDAKESSRASKPDLPD